MGRQDWYYINLPKLMVKRLEQFLETPRAKSMGMSNKTELLRHIINDFLDEQEKFYNNLQSIHDFIANITSAAITITKSISHAQNLEPQLARVISLRGC